MRPWKKKADTSFTASEWAFTSEWSIDIEKKKKNSGGKKSPQFSYLSDLWLLFPD